jgi:DNA-binding FadR family transcriptional regulator
VSEPEFEDALAAYRRLIERASAALAAEGADDEDGEPALDPEPCP